MYLFLFSWSKESPYRHLFFFLFVLMSTENAVAATKRLFVGNLPFRLEADDIRDLFSEVAQVTEVFLPVDRETGRKKGFAFVDVNAEDMDAVIEAMNGREIMGRALVVNEAKPREDRPARAPRREY